MPTLPCDCLSFNKAKPDGRLPTLHQEQQDTQCDAWKRLLDAIEVAAHNQAESFVLWKVLGRDEYKQVITLPATVAKLTSVKTLNLYHSNLVRLPPEIGKMSALERFEPYTSYKLHWFPFEITQCRNLTQSVVSTRATFGNHKHRPPFPDLNHPENSAALAQATPSQCSICQGPLDVGRVHRRWISLWVATDVLPLLVNACSAECLEQLPQTPDEYFDGPHTGGHHIKQPPPMRQRPKRPGT